MHYKLIIAGVMLNAFSSLVGSSVLLSDDYREVSRLESVYAIQAAATHGKFVFAIDSRSVAKYDRTTGKLLGHSQGDAIHLNSGFVWKNKILCAHSNYPSIPEQSQVMELDPSTMALTRWREFGDYGGSLTWIVRRGNRWLCNFAKYGDQNKDSFLVEFDNRFKEKRRWSYPSELIDKLGKYSLSGGVWFRGELLVTGHDAEEVYALSFPRTGPILEYVETRGIAFTGQGFAVDKASKGLVGISRAQRNIIFVK